MSSLEILVFRTCVIETQAPHHASALFQWLTPKIRNANTNKVFDLMQPLLLL